MIALALGLAMLALFSALGAGPSLALLGPRWRRLWPLVAPVVGFALVAVVGDAPSWRWTVASYAWPLLALLSATSVTLLVRHRREIERRDLALFALPALILPWSLAPYLATGTLTTLSEHNNDWAYYLGLESALRHAPYGAPWTDAGDLLTDMGAVLRRGGWRAGLSIVGTWLGALTGLLPHQVDGTLWGVLHASFAGATAAAHRLLVPRSSPRARAFVIASAVLSGPALLLLRMSFASHLAAMPLVVLGTALTSRALRARAASLRALALLLLAATITVLADASPYLIAMGLGLVVSAVVGARIPLARVLPRAAWGLLAPALVPAALYRIVLSLRSLEVTGYRPPAAHFEAGIGIVLTTSLGQYVHEVPWGEISPVLLLSSVTGVVVGIAVLGRATLVRARASRSALFSPLLVGLALVLACDLLRLDYPAWKIALTTSPLVTIALAAGLDRTRARGPAAATLLVGAQLVMLVWSTVHAPPPIGVLPVHEALVARLAHEPGRVYLMGHQGRVDGVAHEHALVYLFGQHDRPLHTTAHPASYYRVSWPAQELAIPDADEPLLVIALDRDAVLDAGRPLFREGPFTVLRPAPGVAPANVVYGEGILAPEHEPGRTFRWADAVARLWVDLPAEDACLVGDVRGIPDGDAPGLQVVTRPFARDTWEPIADRILTDEEVPIDHAWATRTLARSAGTPQAVEVTFVYLGRRRGERVDTRPIFFALGNLDVRRGAACPPRAGDPP
ncbi:MAG: hypothetical protein U0234_16675 [Sandaracinus sp.]